MKLARREFLHLSATAAALPVLLRAARAQSYPARPVRIIVGFGPGGGQDVTARVIGQWLSERLGQQFIVENRPGAAGNIAAEVVVKSAPDGYTLYFIGPNNAINATLYEKLNFELIRDVAPVAGIMRVPNVMEVNPTFPAKTVPEFIAYAKANPGKINYASGGSGTSIHLAAELFKMMTGIEMVHVPYRGGGQYLTGLLGGQIQVIFDNLPSLGVTTTVRAESLPDIPTIDNFVPGYEASAFFGIGAPRNTPPEIIESLNRETNMALADPAMKVRLADMGGTVLAGSPADFGKLIADETAKWGKVVKLSGAKPD
jgi:tripartite-type tricarboxylate transporter receptor subunit TctC